MGGVLNINPLIKIHDMSFTTPCFIKKNNLELVKRLSSLGYKQLRYSEDDECLVTGLDLFSSIDAEHFDNKDPMRTWDRAGRIDCGDDENLFMALAALRDDSDYMQWFIGEDIESNLGQFSLCTENKMPTTPFQLGANRKATPTEIIAHFKQKE